MLDRKSTMTVYVLWGFNSCRTFLELKSLAYLLQNNQKNYEKLK